MAGNPLIARIILNTLMFAKVKELLHAPAFSAMPFLCVVFVVVTTHLFLKAE